MIRLAMLAETDLCGSWTFTPEDGTESPIEVPGGGWLRQGFRCEAGTYRRRVRMPEAPMESVLRLELGAVNHHATVSVGRDEASLVAVHDEITAFTPQCAILSPHARPGDEVLLRIDVRAWRNGRPIAPHWAEWCEWIARGLFRSAHLRAYPAVMIEDLWVKTSIAKDTATIEATVVNHSGGEWRGRLVPSFRTWQSEAAIRYPSIPPLPVTLAQGELRTVVFAPVAWSAGRESWWWPNVPYQPGYRAQLHLLDIALESDDASRARHEASVRFGFRELVQQGDHFELNGTRVNFRGDNLQVANYDRITHGDAIDLLPGFLPPAGTCAGWPGAVENFLKLNYNVQRTHMGPWSPYMLDVCDEMGLMLIGESAARWDGFDMDGGRAPHEVKCLQDIVRRDRHHPSIVRWSAKNEPQNLDPAYHVELYDAVKALDDTRPIHEDIVWFDRKTFDVKKVFAGLLDKPDFAWIDHYLSFDAKGEPFFSTVQHNDAVIPISERPFGIGEADWKHSSMASGLAWFATTTALARAQGASEVRPYVLLSSWASSVPGVKHTDFLTEENRHPVYGEDNLPDPWSHGGIRLLQQACHPLLALDVDFWRLNRTSDPHGHFPTVPPALVANTEVTRCITLFNDEFDGEETLELRWQLREGSPENRACRGGNVTLRVPNGRSATAEVSFRTPVFNTHVFLVLTVWKRGVERFSDALTCFEVTGGRDFRSEFNGQERVFL